MVHMRFWIGITDFDWYRFLAARPDLDEVNFWQPSARRAPVTLPTGAPFLFKLHASEGGFVVGGGFVARYSKVPIYLAWEAFEEKNGAASQSEMLTRVQRYRREPISVTHDEVGCIILNRPFFLPRDRWVRPPEDWAPNIVQGKTYQDSEPIGARVWHEVRGAAATVKPSAVAEDRYGTPVLVAPRLGQGEFRIAVTDAYERRCAMTAERTLPALDAAHIIPYSQRGEHRLDNGLLLRKDLHALFDAGYLGIGSDMRVMVSRRIREDYENGRDYYALSGNVVRVPADLEARPNRLFLEWHASERFLG
jgi:putative restriction endonuclease